jgi:hypothetical protein
MKTGLIIYSALLGTLLLSCAEKERDSYTTAMKDEVVADGTRSDEGTALPSPEPLGQHQLVDTLQLPEPLLIILQKDNATAPENIKSLRQYTEHGTQYFEIVFSPPVNGDDTITYDNLGRIKSPELRKQEN